MANYEPAERLSELPSISSDSIAQTVRDRYLSGFVYTDLSDSVLVSVNPFSTANPSSAFAAPTATASVNALETLREYVADAREPRKQRRMRVLPPHIFKLVGRAYYYMQRTGQDQGVLIDGETASGKSEIRRLAIKALVELGVPPPGKRGSKLAYQIPAAEFILDSFSKHYASDNADASAVARYSELQFNESGKLLGCKMLEYFLQKNLVVNHPSGERTFHVLHYLYAGASAEEKEFMAFEQGEPFRYLSGASGRMQHPHTARADAVKFAKLKQAFKNVGLTKKQVANVCQVLAAILHLGNVEFYQESSRTADAASVRNPNALALAARFLGVPGKALQEALTFKTKLVRHEVCTILCDAEGAAANRDELAKNLYGLLSSWLCEQLNSKLSRDDFDAYVGLVDIPGFVNLPARNANSLDQLVVNFANEYLHHWCLHSIFESKRDEYLDEGIAHLAPEVSYFDNSESLRLFLNQPGGLIHIIDDQTRRMPKKTNHTMVDAFGKRWGNHPAFKVGPVGRSGFATFTVSHYAGPVTYTSEQLLEKNDEAVNPDFVSLLKGSNAGEAPLRSIDESETAPQASVSPGSSSSFIRALFASNVLKTQTDPRNQRAVVAAQQSVEPTRAPSVRRPHRGATLRRGNTLRRGGGGGGNGEDDEEEDDYGNSAPAANTKDSKGPGSICGVMGEFRSAFETLFETFGDTKPWFVFCLRPNESQLPNQVDLRVLKEQVASLGLAEMARKLVSDFSVSMTYAEFGERYADTPSLRAIDMGSAVGGELRQKFSSAKEVMDWDDYQAAAGRVKAFLAYPAFRELEDELRVIDPDEMRAHEKRVLADEQGLARQEYVDPYSPEGLLDESSRFNMNDGPDLFSEHDQEAPRARNLGADVEGGETHDGEALLVPQNPFGGDHHSVHSGVSGAGAASVMGSDVYAPSHNMFAGLAPTEAGGEKAGVGVGADEEVARKLDEGAVAEEVPTTSARKQWVALTWALTFWLPSFVLSWCGMKRPDIRQAWREKLAINMMIWFTCGCAVFVIAVLGRVICPTQHVYNQQEFSSHKNPAHAFTSIRGEVFDLTKLAKTHRATVPVVPTKMIMRYAGQDATPIFPVQVNALCNGVTGSVSPWVQLSSTNETDPNMQYHDFRTIHTNDARPDWYYEQMWVMRYQARVGFMGYTKSEVKDFVGDGRIVAIYDDKVYEITDYVNQGDQGILQAPKGQQVPDGIDAKFLDGNIVSLFKSAQGGDITKKMNSLKIDPVVMQRQRACLRNLYLIGEVDHRNDTACKFANYILLALSIFMVSIIGFKFLSALQFTSPRAPMDHDKFVICQVPCYTEGDEEIRKTVNSIAALRYDDKRKLMLIICDGMIVGSGNDRPTPRVVLDVLGANPNLDPEPLSYLSLGEGSKQHNMAKIYSGLYEHLGHVVPYLVVAKCGKPTERARPGNRGKRDSQLILMRFFNKVHFGLPMTPIELEMYHQIKNVIGVNPSFYEYLLQVDADTEVDTLCLNHFISFFTNDKKVIGLCGETALANAKQSFITMLQVYEYYISHYLTKAFESLFASVTCLPGCFSMFRLRTPDTHRPLFIATPVVEEYSENRVDTLHTKNLLHLGEDRYLTTLVLKHFPQYKTQFCGAAKCKTTAPDAWGVLLSQRRRWINSTVHNLFELIWTPGLCGFCCFSMRFIVMIDLLSTVIAPVTVAYIVYLIAIVASHTGSIPTTSIILLAAIYGLQAIIFLLHRKFEMIGWMVVYMIGIPIWSLFLPLYSFWHMDDFSWGNTRVVTGETGQKVVIHEEGTFDPSEIPLKTWTEYENELWERGSNHSIGSLIQAREEEAKSGYGSHPPTLYAPSLVGGSKAGSAYGSQWDMGGSQYGANDLKEGSLYAGTPGPGAFTPGGNVRPAGYASGYNTPGNMASMYGAGSIHQQGPPSMYGGSQAAMQSGYMTPGYTQQPGFGAGYGGYATPGGWATPAAQRDTMYGAPSGVPADNVLEAEVRAIIASADLSKITKKQIRLQLERKYATSLTSKKEFLNQTIERVLSEAM